MGVSIFASGPSSENISIVIVKGLNKNIEKKTLKIVSCALNKNWWWLMFLAFFVVSTSAILNHISYFLSHLLISFSRLFRLLSCSLLHLPPFLLLFGTPSPLCYVPTTLLPCFVTSLAASVRTHLWKTSFFEKGGYHSKSSETQENKPKYHHGSINGHFQ